MIPSPWFIRKTSKSCRFRLYCFPYAGGSGNSPSFASWQAQVHPKIEICAIQYPGRGTRFNETQFSNLENLIAELAKAMQQETKLPFAFFGHSFGGLVAFELTRYLARNNLAKPEHLFASGCDAPQHRGISENLHTLDDSSLIEVLKGYAGTPPEVLQHRELMELMLPTIRADFKLVEDYQYRPDRVLALDLSIMAGKTDDFDSTEQVSGWKKETSKDCKIYWFEGDHFFIHSDQASVIKQINSTLVNLGML